MMPVCAGCSSANIMAVLPGSAPVEGPGGIVVLRGAPARAWCWECWPCAPRQRALFDDGPGDPLELEPANAFLPSVGDRDALESGNGARPPRLMRSWGAAARGRALLAFLQNQRRIPALASRP